MNLIYDPDSKTETFFFYDKNGLLDKASRGNDLDSFNYYSYEFYWDYKDKIKIKF